MQEKFIGIIADTHDNRKNIVKAVELFNAKGAALVVHAGDFVAPFTALDFKKLHCPLEMVFGNNDGERVGLSKAFGDLGTLLPGPRTFSFQGKKFLLMHEPGCLSELIKAKAVDVVICGHTHEVDIRQGPPLVVNPGEAGGWLKGKATIVMLEMVKMKTEIITLDS